MEGEELARHLRVAVDARHFAVTLFLDAAGGDHPLAYRFAGFAGTGVGHLLEGDGDDFYLQVDAVQQRAGDAVQVLLHLPVAAHAGLGGVVVVAARAGVHGGYEHEACGIFHVALHARDGDFAVFQRLAKHFQHVAAEFGQFVEEQHAVVSQADFAGLGIVASTGHGNG